MALENQKPPKQWRSLPKRYGWMLLLGHPTTTNYPKRLCSRQRATGRPATGRPWQDQKLRRPSSHNHAEQMLAFRSAPQRCAGRSRGPFESVSVQDHLNRRVFNERHCFEMLRSTEVLWAETHCFRTRKGGLWTLWALVGWWGQVGRLCTAE